MLPPAQRCPLEMDWGPNNSICHSEGENCLLSCAGTFWSWCTHHCHNRCICIALGAVLSQEINGKNHPIAFASKTLSPAKRKYSAGEREALACICACEHWHNFLFGRKFTLRTDHEALTTLLTSSGSGHKPLQLHRWSDQLYQYNFSVEYISGSTNHVADMLSRIVHPSCSDPLMLYDVEVLEINLAHLVSPEEL